MPLEVGLISDCIQEYDRDTNVDELKANVDLLETVRAKAVARIVNCQQRTAQHFNKKVRSRSFEVGNYVLRETEASMPSEVGKLKLNWEGPYLVSSKLHSGTYKLQTLDGKLIKNTWHATRLKKYYQ